MNTVRDAKLERIPGPKLHTAKRPYDRAITQKAAKAFKEREEACQQAKHLK